VFIAFGLAVGACDSSASPATSGIAASTTTPSPTAVPSPTPEDVSAPFKAHITAANDGELAITGSSMIGFEQAAVSGSIVYAGGDSSEVLTTTASGAMVSAVSTIRVMGLEYRKLDDGPWLKDATPPAAGSDLWTYLHGVTGVTDVGLERHDGVTAHRLEIGGGEVFDPAAIGIPISGSALLAANLVFYAADDGTPLAMTVSLRWTQPGAADRSMDLDLAFAKIGGVEAIPVPDHVWNRFTSTRFKFSVAYPDGWTADTTQKLDDYLNGPGVMHVGGRRLKANGKSLSAWTTSILAEHDSVRKDYLLLGSDRTTLAGEPGRLLTSTYHDFGQELVCFEVLALHGGYLYDIFWVAPVKTRDIGIVTFRQVLATFGYS